MLFYKEIKKYLKKNKSYEIFDINYTKEERYCIDNFIITKYGTYASYNTINNLGEFIKNIGNNKKEDIDIMMNIIKKLLFNILSGYKTDSYYIVIRIQGKNPLYNIPRWHCDGYYYENKNKLQTKFVTVLRGNTTLILDMTKEEKEHFHKLKEYKDKDIKIVDDLDDPNRAEKRKIIAENIKGKQIHITNNQGIIFVAGDKDKCLVHSEPKFEDSRIFISILPGSKEDIESTEKLINELNKK